MKPGDITISIDELLLDGIPAGDVHRMSSALSSELSRLIAERGLPARLLAEGASARVQVASIKPAEGQTEERIGAEVANAIYRGWEP